MSLPGLAIGLRVKTGRAVAVVVAESAGKPRALERRELVLFDPETPHTKHPYHLELELDAKSAAPLLARALEIVRKLGRRELEALAESVTRRGASVCGVGLVAGSLGDPARLGNPHVRAHALEGRLYWQVLDEAARGLGIPSSVVADKDLWALAEKSLQRSPETMRAVVSEWGRELGRPWGADQKSAALAAWTMLSA